MSWFVKKCPDVWSSVLGRVIVHSICRGHDDHYGLHHDVHGGHVVRHASVINAADYSMMMLPRIR